MASIKLVAEATNIIYTADFPEARSLGFQVFPGSIAVVRGFNFATRLETEGGPVDIEKACLNMVVLKKVEMPSGKDTDCCGYAIDLFKYDSDVEHQEVIQRNCQEVKLSCENNVLVIVTPGNYVFTMNTQPVESKLVLTLNYYKNNTYTVSPLAV